MTTQLIADIIDHAISIVGGAMALLIGYRLIGPKPGINPKFDAFHGKWGKHLKWLGPVVILFAFLQMGLAIYGIA
jgi:hypothetical protein